METLRREVEQLLRCPTGQIVDLNNERIQIQTPFIRPNGEYIDVFLVKKGDEFLLSDFADTWDYRRNLTGGGDPQFDMQLLERLGVKRENGQLIVEMGGAAGLVFLPAHIVELATACMYCSVGA